MGAAHSELFVVGSAQDLGYSSLTSEFQTVADGNIGRFTSIRHESPKSLVVDGDTKIKFLVIKLAFAQLRRCFADDCSK